MKPTELLEMIERDGARLVLSPSGKLRVLGDPVHVERWIPVIGQYQAELTTALQVQASANTAEAGA